MHAVLNPTGDVKDSLKRIRLLSLCRHERRKNIFETLSRMSAVDVLL